MAVEAPEIVETENTRVACDGGGGALGHPRVYLEMGAKGFWLPQGTDPRKVAMTLWSGKKAWRSEGGEYLFVPGLNALRGITEQKF